MNSCRSRTFLLSLLALLCDSTAFTIGGTVMEASRPVMRSTTSLKRPLHNNRGPRLVQTNLPALLDPTATLSIGLHQAPDAAFSETAISSDFFPSLMIASTLDSPDMEAEVLTDLSHVVMDFTSYFTPHSKTMNRLMYSVIGRLLVLGADWVPDHIIHPEELGIQLFFLAVSLNEALKSNRP